MEKEKHPVLERYDPSPLQFDDTAGVINIPTLTILEEAMETYATACDSNCLVNSSFCSLHASMCGCFKTGYFDAQFHDYDKNDAISDSSADKMNENFKSLTTKSAVTKSKARYETLFYSISFLSVVCAYANLTLNRNHVLLVVFILLPFIHSCIFSFLLAQAVTTQWKKKTTPSWTWKDTILLLFNLMTLLE